MNSSKDMPRYRRVLLMIVLSITLVSVLIPLNPRISQAETVSSVKEVGTVSEEDQVTPPPEEIDNKDESPPPESPSNQEVAASEDDETAITTIDPDEGTSEKAPLSTTNDSSDDKVKATVVETEIAVSGTVVIEDEGILTIGNDPTEHAFDENTILKATGDISIKLLTTSPAILKALVANNETQTAGRNVTITGPGHLSFSDPDGDSGSISGLYCQNLTIENATVDATGHLYGIWATGQTIITNSTVNASYNVAIASSSSPILDLHSVGLFSQGDLTMIASDVYGRGHGGTSAGNGSGSVRNGFGGGLLCNGDIVQTGGTTTAYAGNGEDSSMSRAGIYASGSITVQDATMIGYGWYPTTGGSGYYSRGISATNLYAYNSTVEGHLGDDWNAGIFIYAESPEAGGHLVAEGSRLYGEGETVGVTVAQTVTLTDSSLEGYQSHEEINNWNKSAGVAGVYLAISTARYPGSSVSILTLNGNSTVHGWGFAPTYGVLAGTCTINDTGSSVEGKGVVSGTHIGTLDQAEGTLLGTATGLSDASGVHIGSGKLRNGSITGSVESQGTASGVCSGVRINNGEFSLTEGSVTGTVDDSLAGTNTYGVYLNETTINSVVHTASLAMTAGTVHGTAMNGTGVGGLGPITLAGTATEQPILEGFGGYAGVHTDAPITLSYATLNGTSYDEVQDDPETRAGVYSGTGGISVEAGTITGTTKQLYSTTSGAVNAAENGITVTAAGGTAGHVTEIYQTPYQTISNDTWYTPFVDTSLTMTEGDFVRYSWNSQGALTLNDEFGFKSDAASGTADLRATRTTIAGDKNNMRLSEDGNSHTVQFSVFLKTATPLSNDHEVVFDANGGSYLNTEGGNVITVADGDTITSSHADANTVARPGFNFSGWALNSERGTVHDFSQAAYTVTADTTFVATWTPKNVPYSVYYVLKGTEDTASPVELAPRCSFDASFPHGTIIEEVPDPVGLHEKYQCVGFNLPYTLIWHDSFDLMETQGITPQAEFASLIQSPNTIVMLYDIRSFTVTYVDPDGNVIDTETVLYGEDGTPPIAPIRSGETFSSWDGDYTEVTSDRMIVAVYQTGSSPVSVTDSETPAVTPMNSASPANGTPANTAASSVTPKTGDQNTVWGIFALGALLAALGALLSLHFIKRNRKGVHRYITRMK